MEENLAKVLVNVEKQVDAWAYHYMKQVEVLDKHPDLPHYFIGAGSSMVQHILCNVLWEEQMDTNKVY